MRTRIIIATAALTLFASCTTAQTSKVAPPSTNQVSLRQLGDIPLTGKTTRLDYQSYDPISGRLYIAHLGDGMLTVFDSRAQKVVGDVTNIKSVHGVLAVPELHRVYASATGTNELVVIDDQTLQIVARIPAGEYPDGIAYAAKEKKVYVSDKHGNSDTVIDAETNKVVGNISIGGPAGNSQYDPISDRVFVAVHRLNEIAEIDPASDKIVERYSLPGCQDPHGLLVDGKDYLAFAACESNAKLAVVDLTGKKLIALLPVGDDPDVLAFDTGLRRLYVAAESGVLTIFDVKETGKIETIWSGFYAAGAHTISVDSNSHRVFLPLQNVDGRPVLRIAMP